MSLSPTKFQGAIPGSWVKEYTGSYTKLTKLTNGCLIFTQFDRLYSNLLEEQAAMPRSRWPKVMCLLQRVSGHVRT